MTFLACSSQPLLNAERQVEKLWIPFFKVFRHDSIRGTKPSSTDCEADTLTTTPSRRFFTAVLSVKTRRGADSNDNFEVSFA